MTLGDKLVFPRPFSSLPAGQRDAVPPLHKGGFSLPCGIQRTWGNHPAWPVVFTQAKTAPLCKGSCRRRPTEGLTASCRTHTALPRPAIENQLNHSPGSTIPPAWQGHAVPPLHKGGFSLPWPVVLTWAKTAPLCKGSCRRTPTEGLPACLADDAHTRRLVSSICLSAINPPGMAAWGAKWIERSLVIQASNKKK